MMFNTLITRHHTSASFVVIASTTTPVAVNTTGYGVAFLSMAA